MGFGPFGHMGISVFVFVLVLILVLDPVLRLMVVLVLVIVVVLVPVLVPRKTPYFVHSPLNLALWKPKKMEEVEITTVCRCQFSGYRCGRSGNHASMPVLNLRKYM